MKAETTAQGGGSGKAVNLPDNPNTGVELEHFGMVAISRTRAD